MATRFSILVVDDEPINIKIMISALGDEYDIIPVLNGFDAISLLREQTPDLILLDVLMPELSGFDVCSMIRSDEAFADIPIIFMTAFDTEEGELRGLVLGGIDYLTKPINYDLLRQQIRNHVALKVRNDLMKSQVNQLARQKEELAQMLLEQKQLYKLLQESDATLQESNNRFNTLAEQSGTFVWEVDARGLYTYVSQVSEAVLGYHPNEMVGWMHFYDLHPEAGREAFKDAALAMFTRKEPFHNFENRAERKDGRLVWLSTFGIPLLSADGTLLGYRGSDTDITEMKSIKDQLIHAQKMETIGQLAGGLAHDLNNILSVINGYAVLAQRQMDREQKQFYYLDEVIRASTRAASLTRSLLIYSRKQEMNQQNQNLNLLISTVGSFIKRVIHDNITFTLALQNEPLLVSVDTVQIEQVLLNLATNARDAMADGGTFTIATAAGSMDERFIATHGYGMIGRYAIITVADSGHGMDEQTRHKVFNPFFTTKEVGKGTGLGLSMVMGIIKQHGGFIDLQSEPDSGSVFQLYLPLADAGEIAAETIEQCFPIEKASGTILVAEDDPDTLTAVAEFLERAGYTVITAIDGQDAVDKFTARKEEIELVISDIVMPRKSGKAASEEIRQSSLSVKFIFVSGHANDVMWREGGFGADVQIIAKPILPFEMLRKIRELIPPPKAVIGHTKPQAVVNEVQET
ncbi:MAG: response regulator [Desulfuromonadaceae bacterium]